MDPAEYKRQCIKVAELTGATVFRTLDGIVPASTYSELDPVTGVVISNTNHHGINEPPETPSTAMQLLRELMEETRRRIEALRQTTYQWSLDDDNINHIKSIAGQPVASEPAPAFRPVTEIVSVNDADPDCCFSYWIRTHSEELKQWSMSENPAEREKWARAEAIIRLQDRIDCTACYCRLDLEDPLLQELAWVVQPYMDARRKGQLLHMDAEEMSELIHAVCANIDMYIERSNGRIPIDTRCTEVEGVTCGDDFAMIDESKSGSFGRIRMLLEGKRLIITMRRMKTDLGERYVYSMAVASLADLPLEQQPSTFLLEEIFPALTCGLPEGTMGKWDGRKNTGGCPREEGTTQTPQEVADVVASFRRLPFDPQSRHPVEAHASSSH
jgi:hypothetical protein